MGGGYNWTWPQIPSLTAMKYQRHGYVEGISIPRPKITTRRTITWTKIIEDYDRMIRIILLTTIPCTISCPSFLPQFSNQCEKYSRQELWKHGLGAILWMQVIACYGYDIMQIWKMGRKKLKFTRIEKNGQCLNECMELCL